eukprot:1156198-Pelagomonas_calceolata.AAC.8
MLEEGKEADTQHLGLGHLERLPLKSLNSSSLSACTMDYPSPQWQSIERGQACDKRKGCS